MNLHFLNHFVKSTRALPLCACQKESMETLHEEIRNPEINFKRVQDLIKSSQPDLKIISEDKKEIHSHKLLFGLLNSNLAKILLEDDFIGEHVTVFLPVNSVSLVRALRDGGDMSEIKRIFSSAFAPNQTCQYQNTILRTPNSITISKVEKVDFVAATEEKEEPIYDEWSENVDDEDQPVTINFQKKSILPLRDEENGERCIKCGREVDNLEVHRIACDQNPDGLGRSAKVTCPLCKKEVQFYHFVNFHYYKCSDWTAPGSDIGRIKYDEKKRKEKENTGDFELTANIKRKPARDRAMSDSDEETSMIQFGDDKSESTNSSM